MIGSVRYVAIACWMCVAFDAAAQTRSIKVTVLDSADDRAIPDVAVSWDVDGFTSTDANGQCMIRSNERVAFTIHFSHISYADRDLVVDPNSGLAENGTIIRLLSKARMLTEAVVERPKPEVIFDRPDLHAADLLINDQGIWVLAYEHPRMLRAEKEARQEILRDVRLVLLDRMYAEIASTRVPEDVKGLRRDLRNNVVIEGTDQAYGASRVGADIVMKPFGLDDLRKGVLPWTDSIPGWVLGSNADQVMPAFDHLALDPLTDSARVVCTVVDTFMMQLFRSEYKYMSGHDKVVAMNLADELHVDKEIIAGYMSGFQHNIWFKPVYAPLFVVGDTLLVFDHARGRLRKFTRTFASAGEVPLDYLNDRLRAWRERRIIQDHKTQKLYAVITQSGRTSLFAIDPITGKSGMRSEVTYPYPERVQVYDDEVYYIYRPYESLQKRTIYRERLR